MLSPLDRKLLRDLGRMKGQVLAVSLVMACGLAMMIMTRSLILTLESTRSAYYQKYAFADVFASLKRAPLSVAERLKTLPGVAAVEPRVVVDVRLDLPGMAEPATGRIVSLPSPRRCPLPHSVWRCRARRVRDRIGTGSVGKVPSPKWQRTASRAISLSSSRVSPWVAMA